MIVIAHRLYSITGADQICVLEQGRLADMGTHEELLNRCEAYQKLDGMPQKAAPAGR